ncbi:hypothetical protein TNCT_327771 [Trichonephila clavata]|uniref:Uncharacterized protein n=1 Tax=Trichonephila clavata TaxID=2740835 RepID=A0A8X6KT38_TRICU|nr:hypothetical protein TNCT_327771 [Trichonephila clavata]
MIRRFANPPRHVFEQCFGEKKIYTKNMSSCGRQRPARGVRWSDYRVTGRRPGICTRKQKDNLPPQQLRRADWSTKGGQINPPEARKTKSDSV